MAPMSLGARWLAACGRAAALLAAAGGLLRPEPAGGADPAARVVILANAADRESVELARYYAARRGVPPANIIALPMPADETIGWPEFIATIYQPLQDALLAQGWLDGFTTSLTDRLGRRRYGIFGHRISYLVVCRGVPLRVAHDERLFADSPLLAAQPLLRTNQGAVDSELTLLARDTYDIDGWVPNPLFAGAPPGPRAFPPVVKVTRLDGPSAADARALVDHALEAERTGLLGRYYVDPRGPHPDGERWLRAAGAALAALGFDGDVREADGTAPAGARFDAPAWYFGWHDADLGGPMALPGFRFPPGAVALHIHSYSARTLRSPAAGWCGPLVARGVTATSGNVFEPSLQLTLQPQVLVRELAAGRTLGDAAYAAVPALSWQTVIIGDPLYRPLAVPLDRQLARLEALPPALAAYAALRQANLLEQAGDGAGARRWLAGNRDRRPGLVLALALAPRLEAAGDREGAVRALESALAPAPCSLADAPLAQQAARWLAARGAPRPALAFYRAVLGNGGLTRPWRDAVLREAVEAALAAGDRVQAGAWAEELGAPARPAGGGS